MAILQKPTTSNALEMFELDRENLPPAGTFPAVVLDIQDRFGVERTKFQSTETEKVDVTAFLFGYRGPDGRKYKIDTRPMKISGHPKAALYKFLTALMGRAPEYGWDYTALKGTPCFLTVAHMVSQHNNPYAAITAAVPMPAGYAMPPPTAAAPQPKPAPQPPPQIQLADDDNNEDDDIPF